MFLFLFRYIFLIILAREYKQGILSFNSISIEIHILVPLRRKKRQLDSFLDIAHARGLLHPYGYGKIDNKRGGFRTANLSERK